MRSLAAQKGITFPVAAREVLSNYLAQIGSGIRMQALAAALNLEGTGADELTQRRSDFAIQHEKGVKTVSNYEDAAIEDLVLLFLSEPVDEEIPPTGAMNKERASPLTIWSHPYEDWRVVEVEAAYHFSRGRVPDYMLVRRTLEALRATDRYLARWKYTGDAATKLKMLDGGRVSKILGTSMADFSVCEIDLGRFQKGEPHDVRYRIEVAPGGSEPRPFHSYTPPPPGPTERLKISVSFDPNCLPTRILKVVSPFPDFPYPSAPPERAIPSEEGVVEDSFEDLVAGYSYGFYWDWPEEAEDGGTG